MNESNEKLQKFLEAIQEAAMASCREKEQEADSLTRDELQKAESAVHERYERRYKAAIQQVVGRADAEISACRADARRRVSEKRSACERQVFADAERELTVFACSEGYAGFLAESARRMGQMVAAEDAVLYLRPADKAHCGAVEQAFGKSCTLKEDPTICLGGLRLYSASLRLRLDDTLESRLELQREAFRENAGLSVL